MSFGDDWMKNGLPRFDGGKDTALVRKMIDGMGGPQGFKTSYRTEADGSVTRVQLKGDMPPQVFVMQPEKKKKTGIWVDILSGAIRDYDSPPSFVPTLNAYTYSLHGAGSLVPGAFNPASVLNIPANVGVVASSFTGKMAKAVQVILGYQTALNFSVPVPYVSTWAATHGISTAADGSLWLVIISEPVGVLAMRFPLIPGSGTEYIGTPLDVIREAVAEFGGLPSGGTFPATQAGIDDAIAAGTIKRLATVADMLPYQSTHAPVPTLGWSFNQSGSEAHNTSCWESSTPSYHIHGGHFKLAIDIDAGTAILSLVESGMLYRGNNNYLTECRFTSETSPHTYAGWGYNKTSTLVDTVGYSAPVFVCHINDTLEVVREKTGSGHPSFTVYPSSTTYPGDIGSYAYVELVVWGAMTAYTGAPVYDNDGLRHAWGIGYAGDMSYSPTTTYRLPRACLFPYQTRDAYVLLEEGLYTSSTTRVYHNLFNPDLAEYYDTAPPPPPYPVAPATTSEPPVSSYSNAATVIRHVGAPPLMATVSEPFSKYATATWRATSNLLPYQLGFSVFGGGAGFCSYRFAENSDNGSGGYQNSTEVETFGSLLSFEPQGIQHFYKFIGWA